MHFIGLMVVELGFILDESSARVRKCYVRDRRCRGRSRLPGWGDDVPLVVPITFC